jgi:hypothetical protein
MSVAMASFSWIMTLMASMVSERFTFNLIRLPVMVLTMIAISSSSSLLTTSSSSTVAGSCTGGDTTSSTRFISMATSPMGAGKR